MFQQILTNRPFLVFWIFVCIILGYVNVPFAGSNLSVDSNLIMLLRGDMGEGVGNAYRYTALFFKFLPDLLVIPFVLSISITALVLFMKDLRLLQTIFIAMFVTIPAMLLFLTRPQKETIVLILTIIILWIIRSEYKQRIKFLLIAGIYAFYAFFFRQYYFIIILMFFLLQFMGKLSTTLKVLLTFYLLLIVMVLPEGIFMATQGSRDAVNFYMGTTKLVRTGFFNPFPADNGWNFILNYIYSTVRLNFPIFFSFSYKEIFHMSIIFIFARLVWIGLKIRYEPPVRMAAQLILSHVLVLMIFEPDLGSYLRHLTSIFLYLTPILLFIEKSRFLQLSKQYYRN